MLPHPNTSNAKEKYKIYMIKKFIVVNTLIVFGLMTGFTGASAQTVNVAGTVDGPVSIDTRVDVKVRGAIDTLRTARVRFQSNSNDVEVRRDHVRNLISVLRTRIDAHKALRAADKDLVRTLNDERSLLAKFEARIKNADAAELRVIANEIKVRRANDPVRMGILRSYFVQLNTGVKAAEHRSDRVADVLATLARDGKNVTALQGKLTDADRDIAQAATIVANLETRISATGGTFDLDAIKASMKEAAKNLIEAYRILGEIVDGAKAL